MPTKPETSVPVVPAGPLLVKLPLAETSGPAMVLIGAGMLAGVVVPLLVVGAGHRWLMVPLCLLVVAGCGVAFALLRRHCCSFELPPPYRRLRWRSPGWRDRELDVQLIERVTTPVDQDDETARYQLALELTDGSRVLLCDDEWHQQSHAERLAQAVRRLLEEGRRRAALDAAPAGASPQASTTSGASFTRAR